MTDWLEPKEMEVFSGEEVFDGTDLSVGEFWKWSSNDLRENVTRGILAEFLVAQAVGDPSKTRSAWADYDVASADGTTIEVKSSAYLQSWRQRKPSQIVFSGLRSRSYSYETNAMSEEPEYSAEVYVFAVQNCTEPAEYDPLDLSCWGFYVLPVSFLIDLGSPKAISKSRLDKLGVKKVSYEGLSSAVEEAAQVVPPETSERIRYGEDWDEKKFIAALETRYADQPELAQRMIAVYSGLLDAGAELNPGGRKDEPSANFWLGSETKFPVSVSVYQTGIAVNFGYIVGKREPQELRRLTELIRDLPGTEPYHDLEAQGWRGRGTRTTIPPEDILPTDEAPRALVNALVAASIPAEE